MPGRLARALRRKETPEPMDKKLKTEAPVASLLEAAKISQSDLARLLGLTRAPINAAIKRGSGVRLQWLVEAAKAAGFDVEIRLKPERRRR